MERTLEENAEPNAPPSGRALLRRELRRHGLLLAPSPYNAARRAVEGAGSAVLLELRQLLHRKAGASLEGLYREPDYLRVAGFGAALTRYLTEPWTRRNCTPVIVRMGATCNLIVSLFDHLIDGPGARPADVLAPGTLGELAHAASRWQLIEERRRIPVPASWQVLCLVAQYFDDLDQIAPPEDKTPLRRLLLSRIWRMYFAETAPPASSQGRSCVQRLRIGAMPFLVMALPAWIVAPSRETSLRANALWILRFGTAIGWTDDFEDLEHDRLTRHPNRLGHFESLEAVESKALRLAEKLSALRRQREAAQGSARTDDDMLPLLLSSWLGGPDIDSSVVVGSLDPAQRERSFS